MPKTKRNRSAASSAAHNLGPPRRTIAAPKPIPAWVGNTATGDSYWLTMFDSAGGSIEEIDLSRKEYLGLKRHLAAVRGYTSGDAAERVAELVREMANPRVAGDDALPSADPQQVAVYLIVAREFYRRCPEALVCPEKGFGEALRKLAG